MAENDYTHTDLSLHGRHTPDYSKEIDANGNPYQQELPGHYEIGVEIDGAFIPIVRLKAAGLFTDIERAKASQQTQQTQPEQQTPPPDGEQQQTPPPGEQTQPPPEQQQP